MNICENHAMANEKIRQDKYDLELPQSVIEFFARFLVPEIRRYYDSKQGEQEFAERQEAQEMHKE